jgi:hypothetical protein
MSRWRGPASSSLPEEADAAPSAPGGMRSWSRGILLNTSFWMLSDL